jgi:hypothetical protein
MRIFTKVAALHRDDRARRIGEEGDKRAREAGKWKIAKLSGKTIGNEECGSRV